MTRRVRIQSIPRQYQDGFVKIRDASDQTLQQLLSTLDEASLIMNADTLAERLASGVEAISHDDMSDILWSLLSVYSLREDFDLSTSEAAANVAQAMQDSSLEKLALSDEDRGKFEERLVALLSSSRLDLVGKASALTLEHEHFMREARIVTDIRPVFASDPASRPSGALITYTLRLTYIDSDNRRRDFYIALDAADVRDLKDSLKRAEKKASSLKLMLDAAEIPLIDLE